MNARLQFFPTAGGAGVGPFFCRQYLYITTLPSAANRIISGRDSNLGVDYIYITLDNAGLLRLYNTAGTQIGSASSALSTGTWYCIEWKFFRDATAGIVEARLDGTVFATSSVQTNVVASPDLVRLGGNLASEAQTTGDWFFDDVAVNDGTGSFQTGYPGSGKVIRINPDAAGDANQWLNTAGSAGSSTNYQEVDDAGTPDEQTTCVKTTTLDNIDMYNCAASGIGSMDTVNVVSVGGRFNNDTADGTGAFRFRVEKASGGTVTESANIVPNSTTWRTNAKAVGSTTIYPIILYQDPDSVNWTKATLDTMQIGVKYTVDGTNLIAVSAVFAMIDYTPAVLGQGQFFAVT